MKRIDLTGQRFGRLTVIRYDHSEHDGAHWLCKCDCGNEKVAAGYSLRSGKTKSCGCLNSDASRAKLEKARAAIKARPRKDLTGQRFGRLVVLGLADVPDRKGFIFWRVRCDCGTEKVIMQNNFIYGQTRSCGCLANEVRAARAEHMRQGRKPKKAPVEVRKPKSAKPAPVRKVYPARTAAEFFRFSKAHGCSVCADRKDCDMTFCKYEKELTS